MSKETAQERIAVDLKYQAVLEYLAGKVGSLSSELERCRAELTNQLRLAATNSGVPMDENWEYNLDEGCFARKPPGGVSESEMIEDGES